MKTEEILVANVECNSCARTIKSVLSAIKGITKVDVSVEKGQVKVSYKDIERKSITEALNSIGYPEISKTNTSV